MPRAVVVIIILFVVVGIFLLVSYWWPPQVIEIKPESKINQKSATSTAEIAEPVAATTNLIFGGDVMLSRVVGQQIVKQQNYNWPWQNIATVLQTADLASVNLESPLARTGPYLVQTGSFAFRADPQTISGLKAAGVDLVSLANNHSLNAGLANLLFTRQYLEQQGLGVIGAGQDLAQAHQPYLTLINGATFGFLSYAYPQDGTVASKRVGGIANMDIKLMQVDIEQLKSKADVIIIQMHAGEEYTIKPNLQQQAFAQAAIAAGAQVVVGHHAHWPQQVEVVKVADGSFKGLIIYGLGNLVFDQMWSRETQRGALAKLSWQEKSLKSLEIIPLRILDFGQANLATSTVDVEWVLESMGLGSNKVEF